MTCVLFYYQHWFSYLRSSIVLESNVPLTENVRFLNRPLACSAAFIDPLAQGADHSPITRGLRREGHRTRSFPPAAATGSSPSSLSSPAAKAAAPTSPGPRLLPWDPTVHLPGEEVVHECGEWATVTEIATAPFTSSMPQHSVKLLFKKADIELPQACPAGNIHNVTKKGMDLTTVHQDTASATVSTASGHHLHHHHPPRRRGLHRLRSLRRRYYYRTGARLVLAAPIDLPSSFGKVSSVCCTASASSLNITQKVPAHDASSLCHIAS
jgi:hypothetical protein